MEKRSLLCPDCSGEMKIINLITQAEIIRKILNYPGLWEEESSRDLPISPTVQHELVYVPSDDGWGNTIRHSNI